MGILTELGPLLKVIDLRGRLRGMPGGSMVVLRKRQTAIGSAVGKQKSAFYNNLPDNNPSQIFLFRTFSHFGGWRLGVGG